MGGVCGIGSIKGRLSSIESLSGTLSIPVGGILDCDIQSGDTVKTFSEDYKTVTTVYDNGNQLVKTFSDDMKTITSVLKDADGTVIVTETKTFSEDGLTISTDVVYG